MDIEEANKILFNSIYILSNEKIEFKTYKVFYEGYKMLKHTLEYLGKIRYLEALVGAQVIINNDEEDIEYKKIDNELSNEFITLYEDSKNKIYNMIKNNKEDENGLKRTIK